MSYKRYFLKPVRILVKSFKRKEVLFILLIDIFYYLCLSAGIVVFLFFVKRLLLNLRSITYILSSGLGSLDINKANEILSSLHSFVYSFIAAFFCLLVFIILVFTILKGYEWSKIVKKRMKFYDYAKLLVLNSVWFFILGIALTIPLFIVKKEIYLMHIYYTFPAIVYLSTFLYMEYAESKSLGKALASPIMEGILEIKRYILPFFLVSLIFLVPFYILKALRLTNKKLHLIIFFFITLIFLGVYKLYFYLIKKSRKAV